MGWQCNLEGHTDVVVQNPPLARQWLIDNNIDTYWGEVFDHVSEDTAKKS